MYVTNDRTPNALETYIKNTEGFTVKDLIEKMSTTDFNGKPPLLRLIFMDGTGENLHEFTEEYVDIERAVGMLFEKCEIFGWSIRHIEYVEDYVIKNGKSRDFIRIWLNKVEVNHVIA